MSDAVQPETCSVRPGIKVSGTAHNDMLITVVVVPTSGVAPEILPLRLAIGSVAGKDSDAVIPGICQVRKGRLLGAIGRLSSDQVVGLDDCLEEYMR